MSLRAALVVAYYEEEDDAALVQKARGLLEPLTPSRVIEVNWLEIASLGGKSPAVYKEQDGDGNVLKNFRLCSSIHYIKDRC